MSWASPVSLSWCPPGSPLLQAAGWASLLRLRLFPVSIGPRLLCPPSPGLCSSPSWLLLQCCRDGVSFDRWQRGDLRPFWGSLRPPAAPWSHSTPSPFPWDSQGWRPRTQRQKHTCLHRSCGFGSCPWQKPDLHAHLLLLGVASLSHKAGGRTVGRNLSL